MRMYGERIRHGSMQRGLLATMLTVVTLLGLVFLFRYLKPQLAADVMQKLPHPFLPLTPAQD